MITVYKVLDRTEDGLYSLYAMGKYRTKYIPGEKVVRDNIFVFLDVNTAKEIQLLDEESSEVWECESAGEPRLAPRILPAYEHTGPDVYYGLTQEEAEGLIESFWA